jgi:hypothetical protein
MFSACFRRVMSAETKQCAVAGSIARLSNRESGNFKGKIMTETLEKKSLAILTNSSETCWRTCHRKYQLQYIEGIRPEHTSDALRMGDAFHQGIEQIKNGLTIDQAIEVVNGLYESAQLPPWQTIEEFHVERVTVIELIRGWATRYAGDMIVDYVEVEFEFLLPLVNPETGRSSRTFQSSGKIDGIARLPDGKLVVVEHKTASGPIDPASDYWRKLTMDSQISRYVIAARDKGHNVSGVVYDVTRKPEISPKKVAELDSEGKKIVTDNLTGDRVYLKNGEPRQSAGDGMTLKSRVETADEYAARLRDDITSRPEFYFCRMEIARTERDLESYRREQWMMSQEIQNAQRNNLFYKNTSACTAPYRCQYFDICANGIDLNNGIPAGFIQSDDLHPELKGQA